MPKPDHGPMLRTQPPGFGFYFLAATIIVLALQGILYLELVGTTVGPFTLLKKEQPPDPSLVRELRVALFRSEATAKLFPENPEGYYSAERHWEPILQQRGIPYRVVSDAELDKGLGDATVLVLPSTACLSEAQRKSIVDFLADGRGIVASGPLGTRSADCVWQGWDFLNSLIGIQKASTVAPSNTPYVSFRGDLYYSENVPTGYRLEMPSQELTVVSTQEADAFWSDWRLRPAQGRSLSESALALHTTKGTGRIVWFGFHPILPVERPTDQAVLDHYLISSLLWVGKQPLVVVGNWPSRYQGAVLVAQEVGQDYADSKVNSPLLQQQGIPAIFLCSSTSAKKNPDAVKGFQSEGEVASSGDSPEPFGGELESRQVYRLRQAKQDLEGVTGAKVVGFGPPQGVTDLATVAALNDAGYRYYLSEMAVNRAVPEIIDFKESLLFPGQKSEVAKIFRISSDDFEVIANYHGPDPPGPDLAEGFLSDYRRITELGGVYTLYFHSYLLGAPKYRRILTTVLDNIKGRRVWITTGQNLVTWWFARQKIEVQARKVGVRRIRLDVANSGQVDIKDASVYLYLPYHPKTPPRISSIVFRLRLPQREMLDRDDILRLDLPTLAAQTYYTYLVGLDEP